MAATVEQVLLGVEGDRVEVGAGVHAADRARGQLRMYAVGRTRLTVGQRGEVLPAQDLVGVEVRRGRPDLPVDHRQRVAEPGQLLPAPGDEREVERASGEAPGPAHSLQVRRHRARQRGQHHRGEIADVDAHLEGRRGDEHVGCVGAVLAALEAVLVLQREARRRAARCARVRSRAGPRGSRRSGGRSCRARPANASGGRRTGSPGRERRRAGRRPWRSRARAPGRPGRRAGACRRRGRCVRTVSTTTDAWGTA